MSSNVVTLNPKKALHNAGVNLINELYTLTANVAENTKNNPDIQNKIRANPLASLMADFA